MFQTRVMLRQRIKDHHVRGLTMKTDSGAAAKKGSCRSTTNNDHGSSNGKTIKLLIMHFGDCVSHPICESVVSGM